MMLNQNDENDDDELNMTTQQIKIRILNGSNFKAVPDEFKNSVVFHHPIHLIKDWSFNDVNSLKYFYVLYRSFNNTFGAERISDGPFLRVILIP
jgi:hypothetical protein